MSKREEEPIKCPCCGKEKKDEPVKCYWCGKEFDYRGKCETLMCPNFQR